MRLSHGDSTLPVSVPSRAAISVQLRTSNAEVRRVAKEFDHARQHVREPDADGPDEQGDALVAYDRQQDGQSLYAAEQAGVLKDVVVPLLSFVAGIHARSALRI